MTAPRALGLVLLTLACGRAFAQEQRVQPGYQWGYSFTFREFGGSGDRLLPFGETTQGQQIVDSLGANLSFSAHTSRLALSFNGWAAGQHLRQRKDLDRISYSLFAGGSYRLTPRASLVFGQALGSGFDLSSLATVGTIYPQVSAVSNNSNLGISYRLSPHTITSARFTYSWIDYESLGLVDGSEVIPGVLSAQTALSTELPEQEPVPEGDTPPSEPDPFEPGRLAPGIVDSSQFLLNILAQEGFSIARVRWKSSHGAADISHELSPATSIKAGVFYSWNDFDADRLVDGAEIAALGTLNRRVGERTNVAFAYRYSQSQSQVPVARQHGLYADWGRSLGRRSNLSGRVGLNYFQAEGQASLPVVLLGADYLTRFRRGGVSLGYHRSTYMAIGFGQNRLNDQATATLQLGLTRRLSWGAFAGYLRSEDQLESARWFETKAVGTQLGFDLGSQIGLGASWVYRINHDPRIAVGLENQLWSFYVSYGQRWRR